MKKTISISMIILISVLVTVLLAFSMMLKTSAETYVLGDLDGVGGVTDSDAVYLLFHTYFPEDYPIEQPVDYDGDGSVTDSDAVYLLFHTYFPEDYPLGENGETETPNDPTPPEKPVNPNPGIELPDDEWF